MAAIENNRDFTLSHDFPLYQSKKHLRENVSAFLWSHQGLNLGPPDYESGATNQLSYRTGIYLLWSGMVTEPLRKYNTFFD